jgi:hypothetical protein
MWSALLQLSIGVTKYLRESSLKRGKVRWVWWFTSVIPVPGRLRQEDGEFEANLGYIIRLSLKTMTRKGRKAYFGLQFQRCWSMVA